MSALFSPTALVVSFENLRMTDVEVVGGKNASLGEMISQLPEGVRVPTGFATTAHAFREFLKHDGLAARIELGMTRYDAARIVGRPDETMRFDARGRRASTLLAVPRRMTGAAGPPIDAGADA